MISIDALFIVLIARRVDLIMDCPTSEFLPVNGTRRPILILLFAKIVPGAIEKVKIKNSIILIIFFILMLLL
jgi:hypothetical protein